MSSIELPVVDCYNRIGTRGDRSCPRLAEVSQCTECGVYRDAAQAFFDRPRDAEYERECGQAVAQRAEAVRRSTSSAVVFGVADELFALDTRCFVEVAEARPVHRVPHRTHHAFRGIVSIHGQLELCVSLEELFGLNRSKSHEQQSSRMLVVKDAGNRRWVLSVDRVYGIAQIDEQEVARAPATLAQRASRHVSGTLVWQGKRIGRLDGVALLASLNGCVA